VRRARAGAGVSDRAAVPPPVVRKNLKRWPNPKNPCCLDKPLFPIPALHGLQDAPAVSRLPLMAGIGPLPARVMNQTAGRRKLCRHPVVVMQPVQHRNRHESAAHRFWSIESWIRIRKPIQSLMHAAMVVPADEFSERTVQLSFVPNQHAVKTFPAKRSDEPLHVGRCIGGAIWDW
jgi:hypothetical protein